MERVLKIFPAKNWPVVQGGLLVFVGLFMAWLLWQSHWNLNDLIMLIIPASFCFDSYRWARRSTAKATTDRERIEANEPFVGMALAVISVLALCISILRSSHCG
jgi:hypothetical protein